MLQHEIERLQREERRAQARNTAEDVRDPAETTLVTDTDPRDDESLATSETHHEENERSLDGAGNETIEGGIPPPTFNITEMAAMNARGHGFRMTSDGVMRRLI
jgi:hypothetical protein